MIDIYTCVKLTPTFLHIEPKPLPFVTNLEFFATFIKKRTTSYFQNDHYSKICEVNFTQQILVCRHVCEVGTLALSDLF